MVMVSALPPPPLIKLLAESIIHSIIHPNPQEIRLIDPSESDNFSKEAESMRSNFAIIFDSHEFEVLPYIF